MKRPEAGGFTVAELLMVLAIVALLAGFLLGAVLLSQKNAKNMAAKKRMTSFAMILQTLYVEDPFGTMEALDPSFDRATDDYDRYIPIAATSSTSEANWASDTVGALLTEKGYIGKPSVMNDLWEDLNDPSNPVPGRLYYRIDRRLGRLQVWSFGPNGIEDDGLGPQGHNDEENQGPWTTEDDIVVTVGL
ncbi:MAG: type II secretion system protein [Planctomycetota bacterium]